MGGVRVDRIKHGRVTDVGYGPRCEREGRRAACGDKDLEPGLLQRAAQEVQVGGFVIDDENAGACEIDTGLWHGIPPSVAGFGGVRGWHAI